MLLISLINCAVFGQPYSYSGGDGSQSTPYLILSKADMETLAVAVSEGNSYAGKYFLLTRDLTEENDSISTMIGVYTNEEVHEGIYEVVSKPFEGTFDGNNHEIAVNINIPSIIVADEQLSIYSNYINNNVGLFAYTSGATIKNFRTPDLPQTKVS